MRQAMHNLAMFIVNVRLFISNRIFDVKLFYKNKLLEWKYGGKDKIPKDEIAKLYTKDMDFSEITKTMRITTTVQDIAKRMQTDMMNFNFTYAVSRFMNAKTTDPDEMEMIIKMRESPTVRRDVFEAMKRYGDLPEHKINYYFGGEKKAEFEEWLNRDPFKDRKGEQS